MTLFQAILAVMAGIAIVYWIIWWVCGKIAEAVVESIKPQIRNVAEMLLDAFNKDKS